MNNKKTLYGIIFILICLVGIAYAALVSNISITGTAKMKANTFDVHFENITLTNGSVEIDTNSGDITATIEPTNRTRIDYSVTLEKPGDFYEFTVKVVNGGTIDAMIDTVTSKMNNVVINNNLPDYLEYNVTYADGIKIELNHELNASQVETYKVRVAYSQNINPSDLPTTSNTLNFSFSVNYIQKNDNALLARANYIYTTSSAYQYIGQTFNTTSSPSPEIAMSAFGHDFFLRHIIENNKISKSFVGFKIGETIYYLRGCVFEGKAESRPIYTANKKILDKTFGSSNCSETSSNSYNTNYDYYRCTKGSMTGYASSRGSVDISVGNNYCDVDANSFSQCH